MQVTHFARALYRLRAGGPAFGVRVRAAVCCAAVFAVLLVALGCGSSDSVRGSEPLAPLGQIEIGLLAQGSLGTPFRLRDAVLTVQGPDQTLFFDTEQAPVRDQWSAVVPAGAYESFLQEGWWLERLDDDAARVTATLLSPNPDHFEVLAGQPTRVGLRFRAGADVATTEPGALTIALEVEEEQVGPQICANDSECSTGAVCCIAGFLGNCLTLAPGMSCPLPDLTVSAETVQASLRIDQELFAADSCAIEEGCVAQPGLRRLLRFSTTSSNIGDMDLVLGDPKSAEGFQFAPCHGHYHFEHFARYELVDASGAIVAEGHKQAFCVLDSTPVLPGVAVLPRYHCEFQGLQRGWADTYSSNLDCQWVDVTGVPSGRYLLRVSVNPERVLPESDFSNNVVEVQVSVDDPAPLESAAGM
jgi:Lysyl oxidase